MTQAMTTRTNTPRRTHPAAVRAALRSRVRNLTARTLAGLNPSQFTVLSSSTCTVGAAIAAGASCAVDIQATQAAGAKSATLTLTDNAVPTTQVISLSGSNFTAAPPTISLTSPTNNSTVTAPGNFTLTANAASPNSSVTQVDYYANGTMIGTATSAPYSFNWNTVPAGLYSLTAFVTDALGRHAISSTLTVIVSSGATTSTQAYYIHTDQIDTPRQITDTAGQVVWRWDNSDPFGNNPPNQNPSGQGTFEFNQRFSGQYADKETNTFYNYFRDYDPATGRYIQSDPIGLTKRSVEPLFSAYNKPVTNASLMEGLNQIYTYVNSEPLMSVDPKGLMGGGGAASVYHPSCKKKCDNFEDQCKFAAFAGGVSAEMLLCEAACTVASGGTASAACVLSCAALGGLGEAALLAQCSKAKGMCKQQCDRCNE